MAAQFKAAKEPIRAEFTVPAATGHRARYLLGSGGVPLLDKDLVAAAADFWQLPWVPDQEIWRTDRY